MPRRLPDRRFTDTEIAKIAGAVLLAFLVIGASLFAGSLVFGSSDVTDGDATSTSAPSTDPTSATPSSPTATPSTALTEQGMTEFLDSYLTQVADDPAKAWPSLTPAFKQASGGLDKYTDFWDPITKAVPSEVVANPDAGTITYAVAYTYADGHRDRDTTRIRVTVEDGRYLISGEG